MHYVTFSIEIGKSLEMTDKVRAHSTVYFILFETLNTLRSKHTAVLRVQYMIRMHVHNIYALA